MLRSPTVSSRYCARWNLTGRQSQVANLVSVSSQCRQGDDLADVVHAWEQLVQLHESLRTSYSVVPGGFRQVVTSGPSGSIAVAELTDDLIDTAHQAGVNLAAEPIDILRSLAVARPVVTSCPSRCTW